MNFFNIECSENKTNKLILFLTRNQYRFNLKHDITIVDSDSLFSRLKGFIQKLMFVDFDTRTLGDRVLAESIFFYILNYDLGMSHKNIASKCKTTVYTVSRRISFARASIETRSINRKPNQKKFISNYLIVQKKILNKNLNRKL